MKFKYADKKEQLRRSNGFLLMGYMFFYVILLLLMWVCYFTGVRSIGLTVMTTIVAVVSMVAIFLLSRKLMTSPKLKTAVLPFLLFIYFLNAAIQRQNILK